MKKAVFFLGSFIFIIGLILIGSCDNKVRGCTDPDSINFNEVAEKNDGSCLYEGDAVFWYDEGASTGLTNDGATALTFYLDGEVIGSSATSVFWASAPDCRENSSISVTVDMGSDKSRNYTLSVKDQDNFEYWNTTLPFEANTCMAIELTWETRKKK